jgi:hypothetical protein
VVDTDASWIYLVQWIVSFVVVIVVISCVVLCIFDRKNKVVDIGRVSGVISTVICPPIPSTVDPSNEVIDIRTDGNDSTLSKPQSSVEHPTLDSLPLVDTIDHTTSVSLPNSVPPRTDDVTPVSMSSRLSEWANANYPPQKPIEARSRPADRDAPPPLLGCPDNVSLNSPSGTDIKDENPAVYDTDIDDDNV